MRLKDLPDGYGFDAEELLALFEGETDLAAVPGSDPEGRRPCVLVTLEYGLAVVMRSYAADAPPGYDVVEAPWETVKLGTWRKLQWLDAPDDAPRFHCDVDVGKHHYAARMRGLVGREAIEEFRSVALGRGAR
jgi:hypothetical protein